MTSMTFDEVFAAFQRMQSARGEAISDAWIQDASKTTWYKGTVDPVVLITPYSEFRGLVFYSKRGLTNAQALSEILRSDNKEAKRLVTSGLGDHLPIIVWRRPDGLFQVDDGCRRSLTACYLGLSEISAYIGLHPFPEKLDYWKTKPKREPLQNP